MPRFTYKLVVAYYGNIHQYHLYLCFCITVYVLTIYVFVFLDAASDSLENNNESVRVGTVQANFQVAVSDLN